MAVLKGSVKADVPLAFADQEWTERRTRQKAYRGGSQTLQGR